MTDVLALGAGWPGSILEGLDGLSRQLVLAAGLVLAVVGLALIRRFSDPGLTGAWRGAVAVPGP